MDNNRASLTVLGCRGSMPVTGEDFSRFGGQTSCYQLRCGTATLLLDAGTGILSADIAPHDDVTVVLTHGHIDHIVGIPLFRPLMDPGRTVTVCGPTLEGRTVRQQITHLMSPPLWPVAPEQLPGVTRFTELLSGAQFGPFTVETMSGSHPGGCAVVRVTVMGKRVVYATDFEHTPEKTAQLAAFAAGAELLLYDGQYTPAQYEASRGFGHSTAEMGLETQRLSGARELWIIHHDVRATDRELLARESELGARFARRGDTLWL